MGNTSSPKYPGKRITTNGNTLVSQTEQLICDAGVFYPITPSTEMGELFQNAYAKGHLNAFGRPLIAIETEGEHAAQGGAIAMSVTGKRTVNFTSGQGIVYGCEQYYHAPGKLSTMVIEVGARALTKHALNVHCGHDDVYAALDTGWIITFAKDAQQAADQAIILRKVTELSLNPGMNVQDGFLTTHLERTFRKPEAALVREFLGDPGDEIDTPTEGQKILFGPKRRRVPAGIDLRNPVLLGPVQNQEHYMNGVAARRNNFSEPILSFLEEAYADFGTLTGRKYGLVSHYNCEQAQTVFIALGCASENIEAAVDYLKETRGETVGVIHINVIRPFPEKALIEILKGKKRVIILERTDESLSGDNPLTKDIKVALSKAEANHFTPSFADLPSLDPALKPDIFSGSYGLGSRDFRPEGIISAFDFAEGRTARNDGKKASDGVRFFYIGIQHPYALSSTEKPSCLPKNSIAVRFHSIGGWGMITTGKNLGEVLGEFSNFIAERGNLKEEDGSPKEVIHISANPKYGSEKKGAPTNYFMVAAPERIRVNCDLHHVNTVLCCDPKVFLHSNPLEGIEKGGAFVWESSETSPEKAWQRIPARFRKEIIENKIKIYILNGFSIAKQATSREDLQTRMQGNSFLGAFFRVSPFLKTFNISQSDFNAAIRKQYEKKFGRFGEAVIESNMNVMRAGFDNVKEVPHGNADAPDTSKFIGGMLHCNIDLSSLPETPSKKAPLFRMSVFDAEFRSGLGYHQPASALASVGLVASGTGATSSKYVSRRQIPVWLAENCTQCMECIVVCPDTALPNTAQDITSVLNTAISHYVKDDTSRKALLKIIPQAEQSMRAEMLEFANAKDQKHAASFSELAMKHLQNTAGNSVSEKAIREAGAILDVLPVAYLNTKGIFSGREKKEAGTGGLFSIFVKDLCKGCAACVEACGDHDALKMIEESEQHHADLESANEFLGLLSDTPKKYLGIFNPDKPEDSKAAALKFHLMVQSKYNSLLSGDGACAGCGEKSILRALATLTETLMRPIFHKKAERLHQLASRLEKEGTELFRRWKTDDEKSYSLFRRTLLHIFMGYGAEEVKETDRRIAEEFKGDDSDILNALIAILRTDAANHVELQAIEGFAPNGMAAMAMTAHTGCNTVFGSTPPNNPHPYPWMNSLFQDGATIGWLIGESFIADHAVRSVIPERLSTILLESSTGKYTEEDFFRFSHFTDTYMTDAEVMELPKVWVVGGDGGMGDIGFQNVSKVVLQNRPNVKLLLLDTQVYSNTGGQNSDSSVMAGGFDMNQTGAATSGKLTEKKWIAEAFLGGHGSPFVAQVSLANSGSLYKAILDGLCYRGTAFFQVYTSCQPEHGVPDYASQEQALSVRDSRGVPEFIFNPQLGESFGESLNIKGNPNYKGDWFMQTAPVTKKGYVYTTAHWAFTEARFRLHHKVIKEEDLGNKIRLEDLLQLITQDDIVHRRFLDPEHRSFIPDFGVYTIDHKEDGSTEIHLVSRQMVLFCVERRKAWRMMQSRAGIENADYLAQKELLRKIDKGELSRKDYLKEKTTKAELHE